MSLSLVLWQRSWRWTCTQETLLSTQRPVLNNDLCFLAQHSNRVIAIAKATSLKVRLEVVLFGSICEWQLWSFRHWLTSCVKNTIGMYSPVLKAQNNRLKSAACEHTLTGSFLREIQYGIHTKRKKRFTFISFSRSFSVNKPWSRQKSCQSLNYFHRKPPALQSIAFPPL